MCPDSYILELEVLRNHLVLSKGFEHNEEGLKSCISNADGLKDIVGFNEGLTIRILEFNAATGKKTLIFEV